ncbi:hypothetical protein D0U04_27290 [Bacillus clarus]|uniref:Uncharacterized protein n=1 Tax=Bacillus clarus TaxID=2338372 RepID=A0ABX9KNP7_9BACI|nr:hypothetical protein D0U04_27290 [Bacillus clarus]
MLYTCTVRKDVIKIKVVQVGGRHLRVSFLYALKDPPIWTYTNVSVFKRKVTLLNLVKRFAIWCGRLINKKPVQMSNI